MDLLTDQNFLQSLAKKVREDATFKKNLLDNPLKTIEHFAGCRIIISQGKKITIVDQTDPTTIFINLPSESDTEDVELNEEQLDIVAGGADVSIIVR
ncbi:TOMM propeptide domain-containing protein [Spirosoma lituiforme]